MATAFVLIEVDAGSERGVLDGLLRLDGVEEVFPLFGEYDFIVKMEASDYDALGRRIVKDVRSLPGVQRTETLTVTQL